MPDINSIDLNLSFNLWYFIIGIAAIITYTIFSYRVTIPVISRSLKIFLIFTRTLAVSLILFLIFEPVVTITSEKIDLPVNMVFVDNSNSITAKDSIERMNDRNNLLDELNSSGVNNRYFVFGNRIDSIQNRDLENLGTTEPISNYQSIFDFVSESKLNISSITVIGDGIFNTGINPLHTAEKLGIPVYTVGIGDTAIRKDIGINKAIYNQYMYTGKPAKITARIFNYGFENERVRVSLFVDNRLNKQSDLTLTNTGLSEVDFNFIPDEKGERKISIQVSQIDGESTFENNSKIFFVDVLDNRLNVLVIGTPSPDFSFIKNSLAIDKDIDVNAFAQISEDIFTPGDNYMSLIDSADILFLVGFPNSNTPNSIIERVKSKISNAAPFFIITADGIDLNLLSNFENYLPMKTGMIDYGFTEVQPWMDDFGSTIFNSGSFDESVIKNLPPLLKSNSEFIPKVESEIWMRTKIKNVNFEDPLILSRAAGKFRSAAVLAKNIWRWKLAYNPEGDNVYDNLFSSITKWLNIKSDQKQVNAAATKRIYTQGENIEFTGQVYDQTFNPVDNADMVIKIKSDGNSYNVPMNSIGNGNYEGKLDINKPGDYTFIAAAELDGFQLGKDNGSFTITEIDLEQTDLRMNKDFLQTLANVTAGDFYYINYSDDLIPKLEKRINQSEVIKINKSEFEILNSDYILIIIITLLGIEWFLRKRAGML
ncbi:MAG: hypothetical protein K9J16_06600 [Melioribacteraceae bacterium]|nr:hypothetical protein [Melioribacteraceae bacterium]MCF8353098.1 hypothetical protein [Melioribacteraceae bacterium]MCF8392756.1 hypothetical protein [Melioribacteraceae bacterium]MCF8418287.1 hypothetical protein [Melioribacteraceae bacterium]